MLGKLTAKVALSTLLSAAAVLLFSQTSFAASSTGKITVYHLNSDPPYMGRGSCIQMNPTLPGSGWACVWQGRLYNEFNNLFREAYFQGRTCTVWWSTSDPTGNNLVDIAQCQ